MRMLAYSKILMLAAVVLVSPGTAHAQAGTSSGAAAEGRWRGDIVTDAFRGIMEITIPSRSVGSSVRLWVRIGDDTASGPGTITVVTRDSLRFTSSVGGAETTYMGVFHGDSLSGTLEARQGTDVLGKGRWSLLRAAPRAASASNGVATAASRVAIFDEAWTLVDTLYGNFPSKGIDWALVKSLYRDQAATASTDEELAGILSTMLSHLNDNHISLRVRDSVYHPNGAIDRSSFVADSVVARRFVSQPQTANRGQWMHAWLADSIGYLRIDGFQDAVAARVEIDSILARFRRSRGIIIDLRKHFGGDDRAANAVINRFASSRARYMTSRTRSGKRHTDFLEPRDFYAEPQGSWQYTRPVVILTSRRTVSAGENFLLGMRELPQVIVIGDVTSGAFADVGHFTLANGWQLNFPFNRFVDRNGISWEGVGLAPDMRFVARPEDIARGKDVVLDLGVRAVKAAAGARD